MGSRGRWSSRRRKAARLGLGRAGGRWGGGLAGGLGEQGVRGTGGGTGYPEGQQGCLQRLPLPALGPPLDSVRLCEVEVEAEGYGCLPWQGPGWLRPLFDGQVTLLCERQPLSRAAPRRGCPLRAWFLFCVRRGARWGRRAGRLWGTSWFTQRPSSGPWGPLLGAWASIKWRRLRGGARDGAEALGRRGRGAFAPGPESKGLAPRSPSRWGRARTGAGEGAASWSPGKGGITAHGTAHRPFGLPLSLSLCRARAA